MRIRLDRLVAHALLPSLLVLLCELLANFNQHSNFSPEEVVRRDEGAETGEAMMVDRPGSAALASLPGASDDVIATIRPLPLCESKGCAVDNRVHTALVSSRRRDAL